MANDLSQDIRDRTFRFACDVSRLVLHRTSEREAYRLFDQLLRAGTSVGANLEEAKAASSRKEFVRYVEISLREAREALYWVRICLELNVGPRAELEALRAEGEQIARIVAAIVISTKRRMAAGYAVFAFCILNFALLFS